MRFPVETPLFCELLPWLRQAVTEICGKAKPQAAPFLIHTMGIPGAGKSTFVSSLESMLADLHPATVAFDRLMTSAPDYHATDPQTAFARYEPQARGAGYLLLKHLLEQKGNIIFEHSASHEAHQRIVTFAQKLGYKVAMTDIIAPPEIAKQRILKRQAADGRYTPSRYIDERHAALAELRPRYKETADLYFEIANDDIDAALRAQRFAHAAENISKSVRHLLQPAPAA